MNRRGFIASVTAGLLAAVAAPYARAFPVHRSLRITVGSWTDALKADLPGVDTLKALKDADRGFFRVIVKDTF